MSQNLFPDHLDLDTDFLNATYSDDPETAMMMFENYLQELTDTLRLLEDSYHKQDITAFRHLVHKQKPAFSYVGLTDITAQFQQLQVNCQQVNDLTTFKDEIERAFSRIRSSREIVASTLELLRQG